MNHSDRKRKFILALHAKQIRLLKKECAKTGITLQELLRAEIIPKWIKNNKVKELHNA